MSEKIVQKAILQNTVTTRRVPMTEEGMTNLRNIRTYYQNLFNQRTGGEIELPYPSVFDMVLRDFCREKNINGPAVIGTANSQ